jgi:hypothetical protein
MNLTVARGDEAGELRARQALPFGDAAGPRGDGDFEGRLRDINGDQGVWHVGSSL